MERMQKRGLSDVVTTVLIILLVLAAVAIIASYVLTFVNKGGAEVGGAAACTLLQLYPTTCTFSAHAAGVDTILGNADDTYTVTVKATKRGSDVAVQGLKVLMTKKNGDVSPFDGISGAPGYLETSNVYTATGVLSGQGDGSVPYTQAEIAVSVTPEGAPAPVGCKPSKPAVCS